jgi:hypothetical protein
VSYDEYRPGDVFSVDYRERHYGEGMWYQVTELGELDAARTAFGELIASDRAQGAEDGSRWRLCHERGSEIIRVVDDQLLDRDGLIPTPIESRPLMA